MPYTRKPTVHPGMKPGTSAITVSTPSREHRLGAALLPSDRVMPTDRGFLGEFQPQWPLGLFPLAYKPLLGKPGARETYNVSAWRGVHLVLQGHSERTPPTATEAVFLDAPGLAATSRALALFPRDTAWAEAKRRDSLAQEITVSDRDMSLRCNLFPPETQ